MNIFDIEKPNAMLQYHQFQIITKLFRFIELFSALALISWIITQLPFVLKMFTVYFRQLLSVLVSPLFIFLVGNVIVLTLLLKSGQLTGNFSLVDFAATDLYQEFVNNANEDNIAGSGSGSVIVPPVPAPVPEQEQELEPEEVVYQDKRIISEVSTNTNTITKQFTMVSNIYDKHETTEVGKMKPLDLWATDVDDLKVYKRSQSMKRDCGCDEDDGKLKRSETEIGRRKGGVPVEEKSVNDVVEELSNEEFNRRIEGFIARQVKFHQEEKLSIVVPHSFM